MVVINSALVCIGLHAGAARFDPVPWRHSEGSTLGSLQDLQLIWFVPRTMYVIQFNHYILYFSKELRALECNVMKLRVGGSNLRPKIATKIAI